MAKARQNLVKRASQLLAVQVVEKDTATRYAVARERNALVKRMSEKTRKQSGFSVLPDSELQTP